MFAGVTSAPAGAAVYCLRLVLLPGADMIGQLGQQAMHTQGLEAHCFSGEKRGAHAANGALGRTSSNASEVQSPLRELPEQDLAEALEVEASLRQDLTDKPLSFSDTMGLNWLAPQEERPGNRDQPWANCRNEG